MTGLPALRMAAFSIAAAFLSGCGFGPFPGGQLEGPEWGLSALDRTTLDDVSVIVLETRPDTPYSVHVQLFRIQDALLLDPSPRRRWLSYIDADARVRIQFAGERAVYRARAVRETDPGLLGKFDPASVVLRLESDDSVPVR